MTRPVRTRANPDEVRARILEVAEEHFRRIGHHKTSVADIASELGFSSPPGMRSMSLSAGGS